MKLYQFIFVLLFITVAGCDKRMDVPITIENLITGEITVSLNPSGLTPLSAVASIETKVPCQITTTVLGEYESQATSEDFNTSHEVEIHGLYSATNNQVRLEIKTEDNSLLWIDTLQIQTDTLPDFFPEIQIVEKQEDLMEPGWNLIELSIGGQGFFRFYPAIFDPSGEIRYYLNLNFIEGWIGPFHRLENGNWIWAHNQKLYEYDMLGREINNWNIEGYYQHHDIVEKPDGNLIVPVSKLDVITRLDYIIEIDRGSGNIIREWNLREVLDVDRFDIVWNSSDWAHVNSIWYDEATDGLVISARHQGIFKVDMDNNLEWIIAPHQGWQEAGETGQGIDTRDYLLTAINGDDIAYTDDIQLGEVDATTFSWPWGQHAAMVLDNGNIFCFDNGTNRNFDGNSDFIRGVEYRIDLSNMTIEQVWQYGKERGTEIYSSNISDVDVLPQTGNRLIAPGNVHNNVPHQSRIIEVSYPAASVVFEAIILFKNAEATGGGWGDVDITYRAERLELNPK